MKKAEWLTVGRILRAEGQGGELKVRFYPGINLGAVRSVAVKRQGKSEIWAVESLRQGRGGFVLKVEGIGSLARAEALAGLELKVPADNLLPLEAGSYYPGQLIGCRVVTRGGADLGQVTALVPVADSGLLVVGRGQAEIYIPLAAAICYDIDPAGGCIRIDPPEGLLDLNEI